MSNKFYAVLLVLAGMVFGILLVSLTSSPAAARLPNEEQIITTPKEVTGSSTPVAAKLPDEGRVVAKPVPTRVTTPTRPTRPVLARPDIRVYPVGTGGKDDETAYAYIVKDGEIWLLEGITGRQIHFLR